MVQVVRRRLAMISPAADDVRDIPPGGQEPLTCTPDRRLSATLIILPPGGAWQPVRAGAGG